MSTDSSDGSPAHKADTIEQHTLFEFPCDFPIKAIGRDNGEFLALVTALIERHTQPLDQNAITTRPGSKGNYLAVTVTITATSKAQLDAIYIDLSGHPDIIMAL
jgi:hypothetical protein